MSESINFSVVNKEVTSVGLDQALNACQNGKEVVSVYLRLNKDMPEYLPVDQEKVAFKLIDFGETEKALEFIKMAEARRNSDYTIQMVTLKLAEWGVDEIKSELAGVVGAMATRS